MLPDSEEASLHRSESLNSQTAAEGSNPDMQGGELSMEQAKGDRRQEINFLSSPALDCLSQGIVIAYDLPEGSCD